MSALEPHAPPRRRRLRPALLWLGLGAIGAGYLLLSTPAGLPLAEAVRRAFTGMGLVAAGALTAIASRFLR